MAAQPIVLDRQPTPQGTRTPTGVVTEQTVRKMCEHIRAAQSDPIVRNVAAGSTQNRKTAADKLSALWLWVKAHVKFVHDDTLIRQLFNEADHFELLISPPVLVRMDRPRGDCDDFTMLILALASIAGFDCGIVTLACDQPAARRVLTRLWMRGSARRSSSARLLTRQVSGLGSSAA